MQNEGKVKKKLKDAKYRYLKREIRDKMRQCPENCQYNIRHTFTTYTYKEGETKPVAQQREMGLCSYGASNPEEWNGKICDDVKTAQECGLFLGKYDKEEIKEAFYEKLEDEVTVAEEYKDIAALQWVLGENAVDLDLPLYKQAWIVCMFYMYALSETVRKTGMF